MPVKMNINRAVFSQKFPHQNQSFIHIF